MFNTIIRKVREAPILNLGLLSVLSLLCTYFILLGSLLLSACAIAPDSVVKQPMTAKPLVTPTVVANNGAIFNAAAYKPLFEDHRPRHVGDTVTINIVENTSATKANDSSASKDSSTKFSTAAQINTKNIPVLGSLDASLPASFSSSAANAYADKAAANLSNVFSGSVTATVIEVLANGFLVVSGEKQISLDKGTEFIRFSGVVNPDTITQGNFVTSNTVADARIEYRTNSKLDAASVLSIFSRFFLSIAPW